MGRLISIKPSFPVAVLEERDPGGGTVEALSLGGGGFAACSAAQPGLAGSGSEFKTPNLKKKKNFALHAIR